MDIPPHSLPSLPSLVSQIKYIHDINEGHHYSASICVRPSVIKSLFHTTGSARTAVGLFLLLVRRSGTHCPKTCGIRSVLWTVSDSHWRHFYFSSTLEVCYDNALYKHWHWHWHWQRIKDYEPFKIKDWYAVANGADESRTIGGEHKITLTVTTT